MAKEDAQEAEVVDMQLDPSQKLEWAGVPLKAEDRVEEEEVEEESEEEQEVADDEENEELEEEQVEEFEPAKPLVTTEDPGEFTPKDYSFEFTVGDETYTISSRADAEKIGKKHAEELTASQLFDLVSKGTSMELKQERDKDEYERQKAEYEAQKAQEEERVNYAQNIANGITYLVSKGKLPKVDAQYNNADWSNPDIAKQPGVKEQVEFISYIRTENDARSKAGIPPFASALDAFNSWQLERTVNEEENEEKKQAQARKAAGAKVGKGAPNPVNIAPKGVAVGRAFSLSDLDSL